MTNRSEEVKFSEQERYKSTKLLNHMNFTLQLGLGLTKRINYYFLYLFSAQLMFHITLATKLSEKQSTLHTINIFLI